LTLFVSTTFLEGPTMRRIRPGMLLPALLLGAAAGCGARTGEVSGAVYYNGQPLPFGTIQFLGPDGIPCAGQVNSDGTYSVRVPVGAARVIVRCVDEARLSQLTRPLEYGHGGRAAPADLSGANLSLIPPCYADWDASGLTVLVKSGKTRQDFDLISR
jgi:hypothetical protein